MSATNQEGSEFEILENEVGFRREAPSGRSGLLNLLFAPEALAGLIAFIPHGGRTAEISESALPFPHRAGNLFKVETIVHWQDNENVQRNVDWVKRYYGYMTPYVLRNPRSEYVNYRDLDFGVNNVEGRTSYAQASVWGKRYYKSNFDRLVLVKTMVDPDNFFRFEQRQRRVFDLICMIWSDWSS